MQVGDALLDVIFDPDVADGAGLVIDGFPRTALQVTQLTAEADPSPLLWEKVAYMHCLLQCVICRLNFCVVLCRRIS